jgi:hypothetical protein
VLQGESILKESDQCDLSGQMPLSMQENIPKFGIAHGMRNEFYLDSNPV